MADDIAASLHHVAQSGALLEPRRLLDAYESTAPEPLTRDEHRWLPGALALIPLHWAATARLLGHGIRDAERAMTAAEAWWSRRAEVAEGLAGAGAIAALVVSSGLFRALWEIKFRV